MIPLQCQSWREFLWMSFVVLSERLNAWRFYFKMEKGPNFQLFCSQISKLDNEQLDEIEPKAQAKNTKRTTEGGGGVKKFEKWR